ncbi:hypothetical protein QQ045_002429 [Rhodiola kirilowii]
MVENVHHLVPPVHYNPPLGLKLEITPSLLELIGMDRGRDKTGKPGASSETSTSDHTERISFVSETAEVFHKVSYIPVSLLKIGNWEYQSRNVGDLLGKFFFNKHALVWEVLDAGMMHRIEIKWTDVRGLKADCPESGHSCLTVILGMQPHFFRAAIPQHRNHPIWQEISDFTNGEASLNRVHILQCPQGTLQQNFERLVQFDMHLNHVSRQPAIVLDSPYFGTRHSSVSNELHHANSVCDSIKGGEPSLGPVFPDATSPMTPSAVHPSFFQIEQQGLSSRMLEQLPQEPIFQNSETNFSTQNFPKVRYVRRSAQIGHERGCHYSVAACGHDRLHDCLKVRKLNLFDVFQCLFLSDSCVFWCECRDLVECGFRGLIRVFDFRIRSAGA